MLTILLYKVGYRAPILPEIRHLNITSNSIRLYWSVNSDDKKCVTGFLCRYRSADTDDPSTIDIEVDKSANQLQITELLPNTTYIISMYTTTKCGRSHTAVEEVITTLVEGKSVQL